MVPRCCTKVCNWMFTDLREARDGPAEIRLEVLRGFVCDFDAPLEQGLGNYLHVAKRGRLRCHDASELPVRSGGDGLQRSLEALQIASTAERYRPRHYRQGQ